MNRAGRAPPEHISSLEKRIGILEKENARLAEERAAIREGEEKYRQLFESMPLSVYVLDKDGIIIDINPFHVSHIGQGRTCREDYVGKSFLERESISAAGLTEGFKRMLKGIPLVADGVHFPRLSGGGEGYFNVRGIPLKRGGKVIGAIYISEDVTMLKATEAELRLHKERLEELVRARTAELSDALARVKTLSGFLPICASCKKVRDDKGYWTQVEAYLHEHSEIEFSHGLCPDCMKKLYPNLAKKDE